MNIFILLVSLFTFTALAQENETLKPFLTDYCTSYPEGTRERPELWKHCCEEHDLFFWGGGSLEDRKEADLKLKMCVEDTGAAFQAQLIYAAVSIGGVSPIRFRTKQWGHAFENRERYQSLSLHEKEMLILHLDTHNSDLDPDLRQKFKEELYTRLDN